MWGGVEWKAGKEGEEVARWVRPRRSVGALWLVCAALAMPQPCLPRDIEGKGTQ